MSVKSALYLNVLLRFFKNKEVIWYVLVVSELKDCVSQLSSLSIYGGLVFQTKELHTRKNAFFFIKMKVLNGELKINHEHLSTFSHLNVDFNHSQHLALESGLSIF